MSVRGASSRLGVVIVDELGPTGSVDGDYPELYPRLFGAAGIDMVCHDVRDGSMPDHGDADRWLIGGSKASVGDDLPWMSPLARWVDHAIDRRVPLLGVCFGHQFIADRLGAPVGPAEIGWNIGALEFEIRSDRFAASVGDDHVRLVASHRDQVQELPAGAELLLSHERCPIAGFSVDDVIVTVQPHPEFTGGVASALYEGRREIIGDRAVDEAVASLRRPLDRVSAAEAMLDAVSLTTRTDATEFV